MGRQNEAEMIWYSLDVSADIRIFEETGTIGRIWG